MNRTFFFFLTGLCLLIVALACRHTPDVVVPVVTPPVSTTSPPISPTTTPPSTTTTAPANTTIGTTPGVTVTTATTYIVPTDLTTAYAEVPQPPADCRIVKMTYKTVRYAGPIIDPEYVTVGNTTFQVSTQYTTTYTYDNQRRLVWERRLRYTGQPDSVRYVYSSGQVLKYRYEYVPNDRYYSDTTAYPVDARGYPSEANGQKVNADGFLIRTGKDDPSGEWNWTTWIIKDLNVVFVSYYVSGGFGTTTYQIDRYATRPEFPALTPFINRSSKNLIAGGLDSASGATYWKDGRKAQSTQVYTFYPSGLVKRRVSKSTSLASDWTWVRISGDIGVTDYEYACP